MGCDTKTRKSEGIEAFNLLFGENDLSPETEAAQWKILNTVNDGWPFYLRQRVMRFSDPQWNRLLALLESGGKEWPPKSWVSSFLSDMYDHAHAPVEADPWKRPGRRLMEILGIPLRK